MFGHKLKFAGLALTGCVFQFLGCSTDAAVELFRSALPAFGESLGAGLGSNIAALLDIASLLDALTP